jgi:hypothetical protein
VPAIINLRETYTDLKSVGYPLYIEKAAFSIERFGPYKNEVK